MISDLSVVWYMTDQVKSMNNRNKNIYKNREIIWEINTKINSPKYM